MAQTRAAHGFEIVRLADLEWQERTNVDGWASRSALYLRDGGLALRLVEWPRGATEPVHTHPGTHATTVVQGRVLADGLELGPLGVVLGFGGEPHGPLRFPDGAYLLSALQDDVGEHLHIDVSGSGVAPQPCAIDTSGAPWVAAGPGTHEERILVDGVLGRLRVAAARFRPGSCLDGGAHDAFTAALVLDGSATVDGERLGRWDLVHAVPGATRGPMSFPDGGELLVCTLAPATGQ